MILERKNIHTNNKHINTRLPENILDIANVLVHYELERHGSELGYFSAYFRDPVHNILLRLSNHKTNIGTWYSHRNFNPAKIISIVLDKGLKVEETNVENNNQHISIDEYTYNANNFKQDQYNAILKDIKKCFQTGIFPNKMGGIHKKITNSTSESFSVNSNDKFLLEELVRKYGKRYILNEMIKG